MRHRENAICLRTTDYSETSQVVHFLTRGQGVVRLMAKGTKRPKSKSGGMIDLLAEGELVYSASGRDTLGTLMEFSESVSHASLRKNAARLNTALYLLELAGEMLAESDPHPEVFDLLHNCLLRLAQSDSPVGAVLAYFQWRLLKHAGLLGDMKSCVGCGMELLAPAGAERESGAKGAAGRRVGMFFSSRQGGLLCGECAAATGEKIVVGPATAGAVAVLMAVSMGHKMPLPEEQAKAANRLLAYHIQQQLGKRLRMAKYAT